MEQSKEERKRAKALRRFEKEKELVQKHNRNYTREINVLCVRFGNKYGQDYVVRLRNMISRHFTLPYTFNCLTDDPKPLEGVRSIVKENQGYPKGWWHKVHMFDPSLPMSGRILYLDLDVIVHANIDKFITTYGDDFIGIRDFNRKFHPQFKYLNSSVMSWTHGTNSHIYNQFKQDPNAAMRMPGDQDWIWKTSKQIMKFWPDSWVQSYKWEIRSRNELGVINGHRLFRSVKDDVYIDPNCSIAVFHGEPNPAQVEDKFVKDHWR